LLNVLFYPTTPQNHCEFFFNDIIGSLPSQKEKKEVFFFTLVSKLHHALAKPLASLHDLYFPWIFHLAGGANKEKSC